MMALSASFPGEKEKEKQSSLSCKLMVSVPHEHLVHSLCDCSDFFVVTAQIADLEVLEFTPSLHSFSSLLLFPTPVSSLADILEA